MQKLTVRDVRTSGNSIDILFNEGVADKQISLDDVRDEKKRKQILEDLKGQPYYTEQLGAAVAEEMSFATNPRKRPAKASASQQTPSTNMPKATVSTGAKVKEAEELNAKTQAGVGPAGEVVAGGEKVDGDMDHTAKAANANDAHGKTEGNDKKQTA